MNDGWVRHEGTKTRRKTKKRKKDEEMKG